MFVSVVYYNKSNYKAKLFFLSWHWEHHAYNVQQRALNLKQEQGEYCAGFLPAVLDHQRWAATQKFKSVDVLLLRQTFTD